jgi:pimeloyl-ACP methyl ester carboxylesterase
VELARETVRGRPGWRLEVLPDVGHVAHMEAPDTWLAAVDEWLVSTRMSGLVGQAAG